LKCAELWSAIFVGVGRECYFLENVFKFGSTSYALVTIIHWKVFFFNGSITVCL